METDRPGDEVDKDHRKVIKELIDNQGWSYRLTKGGGYPRLYPPEPSQRSIRVPKTGHTKGYAFDKLARADQDGWRSLAAAQEEGLSAMELYSVMVEARALDAVISDIEHAADVLMDLLQDYDGIVSIGHDLRDITVSVPADDAAQAISTAVSLIASLAEKAGMPAWPVVRIEAVRQDILEQENTRPTLPDLVSAPEAAEILGVSTQRFHELARDNARFPAPAYELRAGNLWLRAAIEAFDARWERKPGRPRKVKAAAS